MNRNLRYMLATALAGVAAGLVFSGQGFVLVILSQILIFSIAALGLNILTGQAGQVSIGNAAFMSLGAYTSAVLVMRLGLPMPLGALAGGAVAGLFGLLIGLPALRMKGFYLAIATMAFGVVVEQLIAVVPSLGAHDGLRGIPGPLKGELPTYLVNLAFYLLLVWGAKRANESPLGLRWRMVRDGEVPARSFGVDTSRAKLSAFVTSAVYGGIAGSLYAHTIGYIRSADFGLGRSLDLLAMIMIGGLGSIQGGLAGAAIIVGLRFFFSRGFGPWLSVIIGALLIAFTLFFPRGIAYGVSLGWHRWFQRPGIAARKVLARRRKGMKDGFATVRGKRIFYREEGEGEPLVFLHGNLGSSLWYERVMRVPGFRTIALDLPNFGRSDRLDPAEAEGSADIEVYADYLGAFIEALGLEKPILVAHSLGGAVAQSLAARRPEFLRGLVLVDSAAPSGLETPEERYPVIELMRTSRDLVYRGLEAVTPALKDKAFLGRLVGDALLMNPEAFAGNARALARFDCRGKLGGFGSPVLVVWGRKDSIVNESMARETAAAFPRSSLEVVEAVGHSVMVEEPDRFLALLSAFAGSLRR